MIVLGSVFPKEIPSISAAGKRVLDIGCANGAILMHESYGQAHERYGIDPDAEAIADGTRRFPSLKLTVGIAEKLPYADQFFDVVISNVSLLYSDLRVSLPEIARVMRSGGNFVLTMHDWRHQVNYLKRAMGSRSHRRVIDHVYILGASLCYIATGRIPVRPWNGQRETFQSRGALTRDLARAGFDHLAFTRTERDWIITAVRR
jgi:SAM-dependent methyltransferase